MTLKDLILKYDFDTLPLHSSQQKIEEKSDDTTPPTDTDWSRPSTSSRNC